MKKLQFCSIFFLVIFLSSPVYAHKFIMSAWVEGNSVVIETAFSDGSPAHEAKIEVFDNGTDKLLLEGKTDAEGVYSFEIPEKVELRVHGNAGMGHQGEEIVPLEDIAAAFPDDASEAGNVEDRNDVQKVRGEVASSATSAVAEAGMSINKAELGQIVEKAVEKKLRPIIRKMATAEQNEEPKMQDIFGGVGYIFGLVGIGTFFNYRRKKD